MKALPTVCRRTFLLQNLNRIITNNQSGVSLLVARHFGRCQYQKQLDLNGNKLHIEKKTLLDTRALPVGNKRFYSNESGSEKYSNELQALTSQGYKIPIAAFGAFLTAGIVLYLSTISSDKASKEPEAPKAAAPVEEPVSEAEEAAEAEEAKEEVVEVEEVTAEAADEIKETKADEDAGPAADDSSTEAVAAAATDSTKAVVEETESPTVVEVVESPAAVEKEASSSDAVEGSETSAVNKNESDSPALVEKEAESPVVVEETPPLPPIPDHAQYLLVGAGSAAFAAFRAIKARDPRAKILIVGEEQSVPYMRPPLSKDLWLNDDKEEVQNFTFKQYNGRKRSIYFEPKEFYMDPKILNTQEKGGVALLSGKKVVKVDPSKKQATLSSGEVITYDKCLIATGGRPKNLDILKNADEEVQKRTLLFRNSEDFRSLDAVAAPGSRVAIVGGGFLGSELACALGKRAKETGMTVYQIMAEKGNMGKVLPDYLSRWTTKKVESEGVQVMTNSKVKAASFDGEKVVLETTADEVVRVDCVVAAVGLQANTELALPSGLEVDPQHGGFLANAELEARTDLYVAGDCACFYDIKLGRRRVEHHDHAVVSGRLAGENMAGAAKPYWHQSMFWSDLGPDVGYEAIGVCDSSLPTTAVFAHATESDTPAAHVASTGDALRSETEGQALSSPTSAAPAGQQTSEDYGKGIVFYTRDEKVVGILLWNCFNRIKLARQVLKDGAKGEDLYEVAKMFDIYDSYLEDVSPPVDSSKSEPAAAAASA